MEVTDVEKLKEKLESLEERRLSQIERTLEEVIANQRRMEKQLERYSARWGFVLMVGSAILAAIKFFWEDLTRIFK